MKIGVNQFCFPMRYGVREAMEAAKRLGFDSLELCLTADEATIASRPSGGVVDSLDIGSYYNPLLNLSSTQAQMRQLKRMAEDIGMAISSIGGIVSFSIFPLTSADSAVAQKSMDAVKRMLDAAQILSARKVLVIPGMLTQEMDYAASYATAQERIARLADYAPEIDVLIENVWNNMLYSPLELTRFVDETGRGNVGIYFDVANARRFGYPQRWIDAMGKRVRGYHLKDYRMSVDNINGFTNVLDGDVDYPAVFDAIEKSGYDGDLVVELIPPARFQVETSLAYANKTLRNFLRNREENTP